MSFKILFTIAVAFLCGVKSQEIDCDFPDSNPENCDTSSYLSHISCSSGGDCTCLQEDLTTCEVTDTYDTLTAEQCNSLCTANADCRFYKYITIRKRECFLMSEAQCVAASDGVCNADHCESGYVLHDGENCADGTGGGDDGIIDKPYTCPTGSKQETSIMPDNYLKWTCYDMHHNRVNIYEGGDASAPGATHCYSRPEGCNGNDYEYKCNEGSDSTTGVWEVVGTPPTEDPIDGDGKLTDVKCNAPDLDLDKAIYEQDGLEIQCVEVGGNGGVIEVTDSKATVKAQGNCLLLCDWYPILNFYTRDDTWYWKEIDCGAQDCPEVEMSANANEVIYCWETETTSAPGPTSAPTSAPTAAPTAAPTSAPTPAP